jgi:hypothetical protein
MSQLTFRNYKNTSVGIFSGFRSPIPGEANIVDTSTFYLQQGNPYSFVELQTGIFNRAPEFPDETLINNNVNFRINEQDFSRRYLCNHSEIFLNSTANRVSYTVSIDPNLAYRFVYFFLQAPGGDGSTFVTSPNNNGGCGGSGAFLFGSLDLNVNPVTQCVVTVDTQQSGFQTNSLLAFSGGPGTSFTLSCSRGANSSGAGSGGAGGTYFPVTPFSSSGAKYLIALDGINGLNNTGLYERTRNPYINAVSGSTYGNIFQPITSNYNSYGAGGAGTLVNSSNITLKLGTEGFAILWFKI